MSKLKLTLIFLITIIISSPAFAQTMLSGVVKEAKTNVPLPGANIYIQGTTAGTITNLNGEYRLPLKPGSYSIVASFIGFENQTKEVTVGEDKAITLDFELKSQSIMGEEVVVTAMLRGQKAAISSQLNADGIVNIVSEEQIQELPDANAGDALGRLPGISLKRSGGEAENIVLRGLNEKYSAIQLNGVNVPSSGGNSRGVDLSMFSPNSLAGIEVTKALTSDMDGDAIAGVVNLVTKKAPTEPKLRIDLGGGYNMLENSAAQYNLGVRYSRRFFDNLLGVQVGVNSEQRVRSRESWSDNWNFPDGDNYTFKERILTYTDEIRKRNGANLLFDINTKDGGVIRFNNFYNNTSRDVAKYYRSYPRGGHVEYGIHNYEQLAHTINNALTGENYQGKLKITWGVSHAFTVGKRDFDHELIFDEGATFGSGMKNPEDVLEDPEGIEYGPGHRYYDLAYNNFETSYLDQALFSNNKNQDRDLMAYFNLERNIAISDQINITVKAGAKYRYKDRVNEKEVQKASYYNISRLAEETRLADGSIVPLDLSSTSFSDIHYVNSRVSMFNFMKDPNNPESRNILGNNPINPLLDQALAREWYETRKNAVKSNGDQEYALRYNSIEQNYDLRERIASGYAMTIFNLGKKIKIITGLRLEQDNNDYRAKYVSDVSGMTIYDESLVPDTTSSFKEMYVLPNFHFRYKPAKWFDLRLAATKTLARPDFMMRLPRLVVDLEKDKISKGNTALKSTEAWNFDLIASFYKSQYGLFTVSAFYKKLDNVFYVLNDVHIIDTSIAQNYNLPPLNGSYEPYKNSTIKSPVNTMGTEVMGLEFDLQANLKFLPGILGNFILRGNYSIIKSVTYVPRFIIEEDNSVFPPKQIPTFYQTKESLEGQPSNFGNVVLGYSQGGFSARLSFFHQGLFLTSMSAYAREDNTEFAYSKLDFSVKQKIKKWKMELMLNVNNIADLNKKGTYYNNMGFDQYNPNGLVRGYNTYGTTVDFGVRFNL